MTEDEWALFLAGYAACRNGEPLPMALALERVEEEARELGVRRVYRRELEAVGRSEFRKGMVAGIAIQRRCQREHDTAEGALR